jgi:hypothetical protein
MRGVTLAIFMLCLAVFSGVMAAGVNQELGIGVSTGLQDEAEQVDARTGQQDISERGGQTGLLGFSVYAVKQVAVFGVMIGSIASVIQSWGPSIPAVTALAVGIEMIARVTQMLMIVWIARGFAGE